MKPSKSSASRSIKPSMAASALGIDRPIDPQQEIGDLSSLTPPEGDEDSDQSGDQSGDQLTDELTDELDQVTVTLLLSGGQEYTLTIDPTDELLSDLFETLMATHPTASRRLFQIPIRQGAAVLAFPSDRLVGVITDPPIIVEQDSQASSSSSHASTQWSSTQSAERDPLLSEYLQLDHFLTVDEHRALLAYVEQHQSEFVGTTTFTGAQNYRESVVLYAFPEFEDLIRQRLVSIAPQVFAHLGLPAFPISQIEAQLTAHNDGQFYKVHNDNGSADTITRELTYVYYFYREPKPFTGGELVIYDSKVENNYYVQADTFQTIEPRNNSIVFFRSRYMHEVLPIQCPSQNFLDSRFTINGWIRR
ncbi:MAG: 2OG-Fe(II) oxygenase [Elainella sp. Prado103]|nr:2OG-Fe(II) oxygenase [Elainella sp. Prado103]